MTITRRHFLEGAAVLGGATLLGCSTGPDSSATTSPAARSATTAARPAGASGTLVLVNLDGGNDGLNTVSPVDDARYRSLRGALAHDPSETHPLSEGFALHPALARCGKLWDDRRLAVVHGVGFAELDRSHFHCRDIWQAGSTTDLGTGWIGRWLDAVGDTPLDAVTIGRVLPLLVRGSTRSAAVVPPGPFALPGDERLRALLTTLTEVDRARPPLAASVASSTADLLTVVDTLGPVLSAQADTDGATAAGDPQGLGAALDSVAAMIAADLPTRVYTVEFGSFDTHANQGAAHTALLGELDRALGAFLDQIGDQDVTVAMFSEFGRRVAPNSSAGTDHGRAGVVLLAGNVRPGHHGDPPPLDHLDDGDLATTTDFRAVLGGLAEGVLGMDAADLFGRGVEPLTLV